MGGRSGADASAFARTPTSGSRTRRPRLDDPLVPNFGYRHALKSIDRKGIPDGLDLSRVRLIMNGAEPISLALSREFLDRLAPAGLARTSIFPVYGLAEATLAVTFPSLGHVIDGVRLSREATGPGDAVRETDGDGAMVTVGCGRPLDGVEVRITGLDGGGLPEDHVGRVWIRGDNVTEGYLDDPAATDAALQGEGWLDTGDLGFLRGGELHITGRMKDLVIVNGQNLYPHDLEESLQAALGVDALRVAVAPVQRAGAAEEAAVFMLHGRPRGLRGHRSRSRQLSDVPASASTWSSPSTRSAPPAARSSEPSSPGSSPGPDEPSPCSPAAPASASQGQAPEPDSEGPRGRRRWGGGVRLLRRGARRAAFGPEDNLFEQGMSSIDLAEIHGLIEVRYPGGLDIRDFFDQPTIRGLAGVLSERIQAGKVVGR